MTLPTTLGELITSSPAAHAAWHNEIDGLVTSLGLPTVSTGTASGHRKAHEALRAMVGPDADPGSATISQNDPGALISHLRIHQWLAGKTISNLTTADDIQAALTAGANDQVFILATGMYQSPANYPSAGLAAKAGQQVIGAYGANLNGSKELTGWVASGSDFYATRASGAFGSARPDDPGDGNRCAITGCENRNDVFRDGVPLVRVNSQAALGSGKFYEDFAANRVYIRDTPTGHEVRQAVAAYAWKPTTARTVLRNVIVEMHANPPQDGAVELNGDDGNAEYLDVRYNHGMGVRTNANRTTIRFSEIHHQMQMGLGSEGFFNDSTKGWGYRVEDCRVHHNNRDGSYLMGWEAGGTKWAYTRSMVVRRLWSHDNGGIGIWFDINNGNALIEQCRSNNNVQWGIFYEIGYGENELGDGLKSYIQDNVVFDNAQFEGSQGFWDAGQIEVSGSWDVEVRRNIVRGWDGIGGVAQLRTDHPDGRGAHQLRNLKVYDNDIEITYIYPTSGNAWANAGGIKTDDTANQEPGVWTSQGNLFSNNRYYIPTSPSQGTNYQHWTWRADLGTDFATWAQWQGYGQDTTASGATRTIDGHVTIPAAPTTVYGPRGSLT